MIIVVILNGNVGAIDPGLNNSRIAPNLNGNRSIRSERTRFVRKVCNLNCRRPRGKPERDPLNIAAIASFLMNKQRRNVGLSGEKCQELSVQKT